MSDCEFKAVNNSSNFFNWNNLCGKRFLSQAFLENS
jgi:hypothetical protein